MTTPPPRTDRIARIIDAGLNRAREGLRVLEDIARFGLDDPSLSAKAKQLRHNLSDAADSLPISATTRLKSRDTQGDVGTVISTTQESSRPSLDAVAAAAAARTTQALRSIEEVAKILGPLSEPFEQLRYLTYSLERDIRLHLTKPDTQWRLCVLISADLCRLPWQEVALASIAGGAECIQLREKSLDDRRLLARAAELVQIVNRRATVIINDRPDIALLAGADGVHLGQTDLPPSHIHELSAKQLIVGVSCSTLEQAQTAVDAGADYLGLGPMFPTNTKHKPLIAGPALLTACLADEQVACIPHLAIGGIGPENAERLAETGCRGFAVSSSVCTAEEPERICRTLCAYIPPNRAFDPANLDPNEPEPCTKNS